jgi:DNA-binding cell septation regulator SpoVG
MQLVWEKELWLKSLPSLGMDPLRKIDVIRVIHQHVGLFTALAVCSERKKKKKQRDKQDPRCDDMK